MEQRISEEQLEKLRHKAKTRTYLVYILSALSVPLYLWLTYLLLSEQEDMSWLLIVEVLMVAGALALGTLALLWYLIAKRAYHKFNENFKSKYVIQTIGQITGFAQLQYMPNSGFSWDDIRNAAVIDCGEKKYFQKEDLLQGTYHHTKFQISDVTTQQLVHRNEKSTLEEIFSGQVICLFPFDDIKKSNGHIQIFQKELFSDISGWKAKYKIHTENEAFQNRFQVYASDEHNAYYILTPQYMEKIIKFANTIGDFVSMAFRDDQLFIAVRRRSMFDAVVDEPISEQTARILEDAKIIQKAKEILVT